MRETARLAMVRLHYSRGLRQAELARSRRTTAEDAPEPGDLVFGVLKSISHCPRKRPARQFAVFNCGDFLQGALDKMEHVRKASSLESIAAGSWEAAIDDVLRAARLDAEGRADYADVSAVPQDDAVQTDGGGQSSSKAEVGLQPVPFTPVLNPSELVAALRPEGSGPLVSGSRPLSVRLQDVGSQGGQDTPAAIESQPGDLTRTSWPNSPALQSSLERAWAMDEEERGVKRPASEQRVPQADEERSGAVSSAAADANAVEAKLAFQALAMTWEQLCNVVETSDLHPLFRLQAEAEMDRRAPLDNLEYDHGSWDGRWAFMCERDWRTIQDLGMTLPVGEVPSR